MLSLPIKTQTDSTFCRTFTVPSIVDFCELSLLFFIFIVIVVIIDIIIIIVIVVVVVVVNTISSKVFVLFLLFWLYKVATISECNYMLCVRFISGTDVNKDQTTMTRPKHLLMYIACGLP